jgi:DNA polymerase-3 subunit beta
MKFTIDRDQLHAALGRCVKIVSGRTMIPILGHVLLRADGGSLAITSSNLDQMVETVVSADVAKAGAITLEAARLASIVSSLPAGAQIVIDSDGVLTSLAAGRARYKLQSLPAQDFPTRKNGEARVAFTLPAAVLGTIIDKTEFAISSEETRYYLNGIFFHMVETTGQMMLRAVTTDGHRLARYELPAPEGSAGLPGIIVPTAAVSEIKRLTKEAQGPVRIEIEQTSIRVEIETKGGTTSLASKLIDGTFPDYTRVIPTGNEKLATVDRAAFAAAVKRVSLISSERGKAEKLSFADARLVISSSNPDAGEAVEELDATFDALELDIGFNATYLAEVLSTIDSDTVLVKLADAGSPTLFMEREDAPLLVVLMPMRV